MPERLDAWHWEVLRVERTARGTDATLAATVGGAAATPSAGHAPHVITGAPQLPLMMCSSLRMTVGARKPGVWSIGKVL